MFTYKFIKEIKNLNDKLEKYYSIWYICCFYRTRNILKYKKQLEEDLESFSYEILSLAIEISSREGRSVYLNNMYHQILNANKRLDSNYRELKNKYHNQTYIKHKFRKCFFRCYLKGYYSKARKSYQTLNALYNLHKSTIEEAIQTIKTSALNDGIELNYTNTQTNNKIKTNLSSSELSYYIYLMLQTVSNENINKTYLSKFISENFSTKQTLSPQANQIRKHFTDVNENVKKNILHLFYKLPEQIK